MPTSARVLLLLICAFTTSVLTSCAPVEDEPVPPAGLGVLAGVRVIDLSHVYDENTLYWPTSPSRFDLTELAYGPTEGGYFYSAYALATPEHGGTHIDAPIHFSEGGWTLDEVPLERLMGPAAVIDVAAQAAENADYRLSDADVSAWEQEYGPVPEDAIVLLRTGWSGRWPDALRYLGDDTPGDVSDLHFPGYGEAAARLLVEERGVASLGIDTASIDFGPSQDFIVHRIANARNVTALENLTDLDDLPAVGAWILALPMKIGGGSGGPARIIALLE